MSDFKLELVLLVSILKLDIGGLSLDLLRGVRLFEDADGGSGGMDPIDFLLVGD